MEINSVDEISMLKNTNGKLTADFNWSFKLEEDRLGKEDLTRSLTQLVDFLFA